MRSGGAYVSVSEVPYVYRVCALVDEITNNGDTKMPIHCICRLQHF